MRLAIIGSRDLEPTPEIASTIAAALLFLPSGSEVRIRASSGFKATSHIERYVERILLTEGERFDWSIMRFIPWGSDARAATWKRDRQMAEGLDLLIAFFNDEGWMGGGTGHAVECALDAGASVEAWRVDRYGHPELIASSDHRGVRMRDGWDQTRELAAYVMGFKQRAENALSTPQP